MADSKAKAAARVLRSCSQRDTTCSAAADQKKIKFPVRKRADLENKPAKTENGVLNCSKSSLSRSPEKRSLKDENENESLSSLRHSPSKRSLYDGTTVSTQRLPLSPRKDVNGLGNIHQSPRIPKTPVTAVTAYCSSLRVATPLKDNAVSSQPAELGTNTRSENCFCASPLRELRPSTPSRNAVTPQRNTPQRKATESPLRSSQRNLMSHFEEKRGSSLSSESQLTSPRKSTIQLTKDLGVSYQQTKQVLHTALPTEDLVGRADERETIDKFLADHLLHQTPGSLYISGAPGTGKTAVLLKTIERLQSPKGSQSYRVVYINCMTLNNAQSIYKAILSALSEQHINSKKASTDIEHEICHSKSMILLVLDEMDSLDSKNQQVLYTIFEWPSLKNSKLVLIGIANSLDLTDRILPRLHANSWCRPQLLHFVPYTRENIVAIINSRLNQVSSSSSVLEPAAVQFCARKISAVAGDARTAIDVCRRAVEAVETESRRQLRLTAATATGCHSPSKRAPACRKVGLKDVLKVIEETSGGSSRVVAAAGDHSVTLPLQHTVAICTLLLMVNDKTNKATTKEVMLGKFHDNFNRVARDHGIAIVEQSEFLTVCQLVETRGIFALKKARDTRSTKVSLKMNEQELEKLLQDKTLMSSILRKGLA